MSTSRSSAWTLRAATPPEPVSTFSRLPRTSVASTPPEPVSTEMSPWFPRSTTPPEPVSTMSEPMVRSASTEAAATSRVRSPSTPSAETSPTPSRNVVRQPRGSLTSTSAQACRPGPEPEMVTRWPPSPKCSWCPRQPSEPTVRVVRPQPCIALQGFVRE